MSSEQAETRRLDLSSLLAGRLREAVPDASPDATEALAGMIAATASGAAPAEATAHQIAANPALGDLVTRLVGQEIDAGARQISFGRDNQFRDIQIGDVGGLIIKITAEVREAGETRYDVRGLPNPFLGLRSFTYADHDRYAGQSCRVESACAFVSAPGAERGLAFIVGASGAGKSSFAQAGMVPVLEAYYARRGVACERAVLRPGSRPLAAFADALRQLRRPEPAGEDVDALLAVLDPGPGKVNLIVVDQGEELFSAAPAAQASFLALLERLIPFDRRSHVIVTIRVEYLPDLFTYPQLYACAREGIELRVMSVDDLREAIRAPVRAWHPGGEKEIEAVLVDQLAADAAESVAYLPLLQVTLEEIWAGGALRLSAYRGLAQAIQSRGDTLMTWADPTRGVPRPREERAALLAILLDMVDVAADGDARRDVRQRRPYADLVGGDTRRARLIGQLLAARLVSRIDDQVDIVHEALLRSWPSLRDAIAEQRVRLQRRARFEQALRAWRENRRHRDYLLTGLRLAEARALCAEGDIATRSGRARLLILRSEEAEQARQLEERERARALQTAEARAATRLRWLKLVLGVAAAIVPGYLLALWAAGLVTAGPIVALEGGAFEYEGVTVAVEPFAIERYEVTNAQYARCEAFFACAPLDGEAHRLPGRDALPVADLNALQAAAYCRWVGRRLPTAAEWLWALRGPAGRPYPWGDEPPGPDRLNVVFDTTDPSWYERAEPRPVGSYPAGATPDTAIFDLAGNVMEWTASIGGAPIGREGAWSGRAADMPGALTYAGTGYNEPVQSIRVDRLVNNTSPLSARADLGLRCAADG